MAKKFKKKVKLFFQQGRWYRGRWKFVDNHGPVCFNLKRDRMLEGKRFVMIKHTSDKELILRYKSYGWTFPYEIAPSGAKVVRIDLSEFKSRACGKALKYSELVKLRDKYPDYEFEFVKGLYIHALGSPLIDGSAALRLLDIGRIKVMEEFRLIDSEYDDREDINAILKKSGECLHAFEFKSNPGTKNENIKFDLQANMNLRNIITDVAPAKENFILPRGRNFVRDRKNPWLYRVR